MQFGEQEKTESKNQQSLVRISYEMRTRLNSLIGFLHLLLDNPPENVKEKQELLEDSYKAALKTLNFVDVLEDIFSLQKNWQLVPTVGENASTETQENKLETISKDFRTKIESIIEPLASLVNEDIETNQTQDEIISQSYQSSLQLISELKQFEDEIKD